MRILDFFTQYRRPLFVAFIAALLGSLLAVMPAGERSELLDGLLAQRGLVLLLLVFCLLTLSLLWSAGERLDTLVFLYLNLGNYQTPWLDRFMWTVTQAGNVALPLGLAGSFFLLGMRRLASQTLLGVLTLWLLVEAIKFVAGRARPFRILEEARVVGRQAAGKSFPSGHTSQAFFLASFLIHTLELGAGTGLLLYLLALLVGFTRIYVGAHYPRDILAGAILGQVWGLLGAMMTSGLG